MYIQKPIWDFCDMLLSFWFDFIFHKGWKRAQRIKEIPSLDAKLFIYLFSFYFLFMIGRQDQTLIVFHFDFDFLFSVL